MTYNSTSHDLFVIPIQQQQLNEFLFRAIDQSPAIIVITDNNAHIQYVNAKFTEVTHYHPEDVIGKNPRILKSGHQSDAFYKELWETLYTKKTWQGEFKNLKKDGSYYWEKAQISPVIDENQNITHFIAIKQDITEKKELEQSFNQNKKRYTEELKQSNEQLEQFAYVVSHDLQEPLRMVASYLQLLKRRYHNKLGEDADDFINYAVDGSERMSGMIKALLQYSRIGTRGRAFSLVDANKSLKVAIMNLSLLITDHKAKITYDTLPMVQADENQLQQLFQNLISNAIKYRAKAPPKIHISTISKNNHLQFSIKDNGIGIPAEDNERIFMIFQRLGHAKNVQGTGIGLAICKRIVERHGGKIWIESMPGKGSTFYFTLPQTQQSDDDI